MYNKLLLILDDYLSNIVSKGEVVNNYYNPGNIFKEVHIILINNDYIEEKSLEYNEIQRMVGTAKLYIYNLPKPSFFYTFGWNIFMSDWCNSAINLSLKIKPDVIRTYNNFLDAYLAYKIKQFTGIPFIISLHDSTRFGMMDFKGRLKIFILANKIRLAMIEADKVIAVYKSIYNYARKYNKNNVCLLYNRVDVDNIIKKTDYSLKDNKIRILTVNRQIKGKNPENIIKAINGIDGIDCIYNLVGNGELHEYLKNLANRINKNVEINFIKSVKNIEICKNIHKYDLVVLHNDFNGITKSAIEAACAGLPIIINRVDNIDELKDNWMYLCDNTEASYRKAILKFLNSKKMREEYGTKAYDYARKNFDGNRIEQQTIKLYKEVMK